MNIFFRFLNTLCFVSCCTFCLGENIHGKIIDSSNHPIYGVTVIILNLDSTYNASTISDSLGEFKVESNLKEYRLSLRHLTYADYNKTYNTENAGVITLEEKGHKLQDIIVKAVYPTVKMKDGALLYDVGIMAKKAILTNAYEAVLNTPGISGQGDEIQLLGAGEPNILIDGRKTTMGKEQLMNLLKGTTVDNIKEINVMYSTPAKYRVKGSSINIITKNGIRKDTFIKGEVEANYTQSYYANSQNMIDLSFGNRKYNADLMYSLDNKKERTQYDFISHHNIEDILYNINQFDHGYRNQLMHNIRFCLNYNFTHNNILEFAYTTSFSPNRKSFEKSLGAINSTNLKKGNEQMHNVNIDYKSGFGLNIGMDYTYYSYPSAQNYIHQDNDSIIENRIKANQEINRLNIYIGQNHTLKNAWQINYGIDYTSTKDRSNQTYTQQWTSLNSSSRLSEQTANGYTGISGEFNKKMSFSLSLAEEWYKLNQYRKWTFYPTFQTSYQFPNANILQLSLSSDKTYPDYWTLQNSTSFINWYTVIKGNPDLLPSRDYTLDLIYLIKGQYMINAYYSYIKNMFNQLAYQQPNQLQLVCQYINYNYERNYGLTMVIPFSWGKIWAGKLTLDGSVLQDKCSHFHAISFDRTKLRGIILANNYVYLNSRKSLILNIDGMYISPSIQGIYSVSNLWKLDTSIKWENKNFELMLKANDIFHGMIENLKVNSSNQNFTMKEKQDFRNINMTIIYKFGGYKKAEHKSIDTSRFKRQ